MKETKRKNKGIEGMKKSPALYLTMLFVWTALTVFLWYNFSANFVKIPFYEGINSTLFLSI